MYFCTNVVGTLTWIIQENADLVETQEPPCGINVVFTTF